MQILKVIGLAHDRRSGHRHSDEGYSVEGPLINPEQVDLYVVFFRFDKQADFSDHTVLRRALDLIYCDYGYGLGGNNYNVTIRPGLMVERNFARAEDAAEFVRQTIASVLGDDA